MNSKLIVHGTEIAVTTIDDKDYISLTDMLKAKDGDFFISDWLRNRNTVEFLGIWEQIHNPDFNYGEFAAIRSQAGLNSYKLSVKEWVEKTHAIGLRAKAGRYGGTYAYKDIAFEFGMWISPEFKIYLIKEFERLKAEEMKQLGWDIKRNLAKINYRIHTDAIKENLIPPELSAGKNFMSLQPCSSACSISLGVIIPGAKGSPAFAAASITLTLQPGLTPKSAPRLLASRACSGVRIVPTPRVSGSPAPAIAETHSKALCVRSVISSAVTPPSQSAFARSTAPAGSFTASTATMRAFFNLSVRFSIS